MFSPISIQSYLWKTGRGDERSPPQCLNGEGLATADIYFIFKTPQQRCSILSWRCDVLGVPAEGFQTADSSSSWTRVHSMWRASLPARSQPPSLPSKSPSHFTPRVVKNEKHSSVTHLPPRYFSRTRLSPTPVRGDESIHSTVTVDDELRNPHLMDGQTDGRMDGQLPAFITLPKLLGGGRRGIYINV